jgi:hypothetical protein
VAVFTKEHTFNKETTHIFYDITQHSTNSTMDINKYKNSSTNTMNIYKYNEHKQYNEHFKKKQTNQFARRYIANS